MRLRCVDGASMARLPTCPRRVGSASAACRRCICRCARSGFAPCPSRNTGFRFLPSRKIGCGPCPFRAVFSLSMDKIRTLHFQTDKTRTPHAPPTPIRRIPDGAPPNQPPTRPCAPRGASRTTPDPPHFPHVAPHVTPNSPRIPDSAPPTRPGPSRIPDGAPSAAPVRPHTHASRTTHDAPPTRPNPPTRPCARAPPRTVHHRRRARHRAPRQTATLETIRISACEEAHHARCRHEHQPA